MCLLRVGGRRCSLRASVLSAQYKRSGFLRLLGYFFFVPCFIIETAFVLFALALPLPFVYLYFFRFVDQVLISTKKCVLLCVVLEIKHIFSLEYFTQIFSNEDAFVSHSKMAILS